ncbi:MAG: SDR family NAD(P)-dependent oxidoreductase [Actinomycetaceae bacterium]|nr:SDR family NAD(P)-dependent oxidoreductase [Actinomycetaceae bacterium]
MNYPRWVRKNQFSALSGRALITGGTSGIGLAFARELAVRGCDLVLVGRDIARLEATAQEMSATYGVECETLSADLGADDGVQAVAERLKSTDSPIEIFVNNAGHALHHKLATDDTAPLKKAIDVMATAPVMLGAAAGAAMKERDSGVIITTASISGLVPMGLYSAIKALVRTWSLSLSFEMARTGVRVVTFMPGWVRTELHQRSGITTSNIPDFLWISAERAARECVEGIERGHTYVIPSKRFKVMAALALHVPVAVVGAVTAKINKGRD